MTTYNASAEKLVLFVPVIPVCAMCNKATKEGKRIKGVWYCKDCK
jgi:ribosomal protein L37AE/L43A